MPFITTVVIVVRLTSTDVINAFHHYSRVNLIHIMWGVLDTNLCYKVCQLYAAGCWFPLDTLISSTNKNYPHTITYLWHKFYWHLLQKWWKIKWVLRYFWIVMSSDGVILSFTGWIHLLIENMMILLLVSSSILFSLCFYELLIFTVDENIYKKNIELNLDIAKVNIFMIYSWLKFFF